MNNNEHFRRNKRQSEAWPHWEYLYALRRDALQYIANNEGSSLLEDDWTQYDDLTDINIWTDEEWDGDGDPIRHLVATAYLHPNLVVDNNLYDDIRIELYRERLYTSGPTPRLNEKDYERF